MPRGQVCGARATGFTTVGTGRGRLLTTSARSPNIGSWRQFRPLRKQNQSPGPPWLSGW